MTADLTPLQRLRLFFTPAKLLVLTNAPEAKWAQPGQIFQPIFDERPYVITAVKNAGYPLEWSWEVWGKRAPNTKRI